jgi:hypothetical protein
MKRFMMERLITKQIMEDVGGKKAPRGKGMYYVTNQKGNQFTGPGGEYTIHHGIRRIGKTEILVKGPGNGITLYLSQTEKRYDLGDPDMFGKIKSDILGGEFIKFHKNSGELHFV